MSRRLRAWAIQGYSLKRRRNLLGPYRRLLPMVLVWSWGNGRFLMGEVPTYGCEPPADYRSVGKDHRLGLMAGLGCAALGHLARRSLPRDEAGVIARLHRSISGRCRLEYIIPRRGLPQHIGSRTSAHHNIKATQQRNLINAINGPAPTITSKPVNNAT